MSQTYPRTAGPACVAVARGQTAAGGRHVRVGAMDLLECRCAKPTFLHILTQVSH